MIRKRFSIPLVLWSAAAAVLGALVAGPPLGGRQAPAATTPAGQAASGQPSTEFLHKYVDYTAAPEGAAAVAPAAAVDPRAAGIDAKALAHLLERARAAHSDAVVILKDGRLAADFRFGKPAAPIETMSATKSVVNLAIGHLIYTGKIRSLDEPVATFYPEWKQGKKKAITLRQLMNHTSGLQAEPSAQEVYDSRDVVQLALAAELAHDPGTDFFYNNKAVNLLAGIVEKASGSKLDEYMRSELFAPLGITRFSWMRDPAGNPHVMAGLKLDALDLARVGQLMLDGGAAGGQRLLAQSWVEASVQPAQPFSPTGGLLWWVVPEWTRVVVDDKLLASWKAGGADSAFLLAVEPLRGKELPRDDFFASLDRAFGKAKGLESYVSNVRAKGLPAPRTLAGPTVGFDTNGYLGQYLVVLPRQRLVAVRQIRQDSYKGDDDDLDDFPSLVRALVPAGTASAAR
ncbi:MAG TPA: serine hydrolase [Thermoanaerobaculia bacterium]|nr:serine hydrolase [Thermoanaerobaculia bacterium]